MRKFLFAFGCAALLTVSARAQAQCVGDCNGDLEVAINELIAGVNMALGTTTTPCARMDGYSNGTVSVNELIQAVNAALMGC